MSYFPLMLYTLIRYIENIYTRLNQINSTSVLPVDRDDKISQFKSQYKAKNDEIQISI